MPRTKPSVAASGKPDDLSPGYWNSLSGAHRALYAVVRPQARATYEVDIHISSIETFLTGLANDMAKMGGSLALEPDFQRGHKWFPEQRVRYVESLIRGNAPKSILFNCPGWTGGREVIGDIPAHTFECIDGLQRLTSVRRFINGEFTIFGGLNAEDLRGSPFDPRRYTLKVAVFEFSRRVDLLQYYLDLNEGGTVHDEAELARVRALRDQAALATAGGA